MLLPSVLYFSRNCFRSKIHPASASFLSSPSTTDFSPTTTLVIRRKLLPPQKSSFLLLSPSTIPRLHLLPSELFRLLLPSVLYFGNCFPSKIHPASTSSLSYPPTTTSVILRKLLSPTSFCHSRKMRRDGISFESVLEFLPVAYHSPSEHTRKDDETNMKIAKDLTVYLQHTICLQSTHGRTTITNMKTVKYPPDCYR